MPFFKFWRTKQEKQTPPRTAISWDDSTISIVHRGHRQPHVIHWADVDAICAYKADLLVYDDIRLALHDSQGWHEISEEFVGYMDFAIAMQDRYPSIPADWYIDIMQPPFAANERVLWTRG